MGAPLTQNQEKPDPTFRPIASHILSSMKEANDPLQFIKDNLKPPPINPQAISDEAAKKAALSQSPAIPPAADKPPVFDSKITIPPITVTDTPKKEAASDSLKELEDPFPGEDIPKDSIQENFKKLRSFFRETRSKVKETETKLSEVQGELEKYKKGEILPDALKELTTRNAELEKYEKLVALKTSKSYQEKFVKPLSSIQSQINAIAKDYEIPEDVISKALTIDNRAELNRFLSDHFDDTGALEVKQLISKAKELQSQAITAEKEPASSLEKLMQENERVSASKRQENHAVVAETSKNAWANSLSKIREEGKALELIFKPGDEKYNKEYVEPIIGKAAEEYGKIVTLLVQNGLEALPDDLAFALSRMTQLAHSVAVANEQRFRAIEEAEAIKQNAQRLTQYIRPQVGAPSVASAPVTAPGPITAQEAADKLISHVLK